MRAQAAVERDNQRSLREKARRDREMERAQAAADRESETIYRNRLREKSREHKEAHKKAFEDEKQDYEKRMKAREILRMSFLAKAKKEQKDTL